MEIRAYDESYIAVAQNILGHATDFAVMVLNLDPDEFGKAFIVSEASRQFACGNPRYVAGMNGCELARKVLTETHTPFTDKDDVMFLDRSPEYWAGWALAYYQWYSGLKFSDLQEYGLIPSEILSRYILHEADISKFVSTANKIILKNKAVSPTRLQKLRKAQGLTQKELSELSGVSLRMIQLYEQRQNDINQASGQTINNLARALCCNFYEIMEIEINDE